MKILFFASLRELMGDSIELDIQLPVSLETLRSEIQQAHPEHADYFRPTRTLAAVNQTIAQDSQIINDADEVAFFPPVTGG